MARRGIQCLDKGRQTTRTLAKRLFTLSPKASNSEMTVRGGMDCYSRTKTPALPKCLAPTAADLPSAERAIDLKSSTLPKEILLSIPSLSQAVPSSLKPKVMFQRSIRLQASQFLLCFECIFVIELFLLANAFLVYKKIFSSCSLPVSWESTLCLCQTTRYGTS